MYSKFNPSALKILFAILVAGFVFSAAAAICNANTQCNETYLKNIIIAFNKGDRLYYPEEVLQIEISNISKCYGKTAKFYYDYDFSVSKCDSQISNDGKATCSFTLPSNPTGADKIEKTVTIAIGDCQIPALFNLSSGCNSTYISSNMKITFNKDPPSYYSGETLQINVSSIEKCENYQAKFYYGSVEYCNTFINDGKATCEFKIPEEKIPDKSIHKTILVFVGSNSKSSGVEILSKCNSTYVNNSVVAELSQYRACGNDTIYLSVSNISYCNGKKLNVFLGETQVCKNINISDGSAICDITVPDGIIGTNIPINITLSNTDININVTNINITNREPTQLCYDLYGREVLCNEPCTDKPVKRKWQDVRAVSLPLHFTFGILESGVASKYSNLPNVTNNSMLYNVLPYGYSSAGPLLDCGQLSLQSCNCKTCADLLVKDQAKAKEILQNVFGNQSWSQYGVYNCSNSTYQNYYAPPNIFNFSSGDELEPIVINAPDFPSSGCKGLPSCSPETHNITRYKYEWEMSYDVIVTAYSKTDYVPMYVGYNEGFNQTSSEGESDVKKACMNSLCYTEIPQCGDGICDTKTGENCRTCPADCKKGPEGDFKGDCITNGCTTCPSSDPTFVDERGCVINWKKEKDDCLCENDQCDPNDPRNLKCTWETEYQQLGPYGKCCPSGEVWNPKTERCEYPRGVRLTYIEFEFGEPPKIYGIFPAQSYCCNIGREILGSPRCTWIKVKLYIQNFGRLTENVSVSMTFGQARDNSAAWLGKEIELSPGNSTPVELHFGCVYPPPLGWRDWPRDGLTEIPELACEPQYEERYDPLIGHYRAIVYGKYFYVDLKFLGHEPIDETNYAAEELENAGIICSIPDRTCTVAWGPDKALLTTESVFSPLPYSALCGGHSISDPKCDPFT